MEVEKKEQEKDVITQHLRWLLLVGFALITLIVSWNSDDAYHAYIMAENLVTGKGFVYNVGYRVTASTCPLYTLITAFQYLLMGKSHMFFAGIISGVIFSSAAVYVMLFKICKSKAQIVSSFCCLLFSYCFMTFTTAGLENSLLFFLSAIFFHLFFQNEEFDRKNLFLLALVLGLAALTRMDAVLLFVPAICFGFLFCSSVSFGKKVAVGLCGLLPFIGWLIFSLIYYGYLFPNTMYIKLNTGFPEADYIARGFDFLYRSFCADPGLLLAPAILIIMSVVSKNAKLIFMSMGCLLYICYVIYIGGDFMLGRHLTVPYFIAIQGVLYGLNFFASKEDNKSANRYPDYVLPVLAAVGLIFFVFVRPLATKNLYDKTFDSTVTGVSDERSYYIKSTGLVNRYLNSLFGTDVLKEEYYNEVVALSYEWLRSENMAGTIVPYLSGITNYYVQRDGNLYLTDPFGLMDPLLSHLPAVRENAWRTGHMQREIPDGYFQSVETGTNMIVNESLHEYYDKILMIVTGDIWNRERFETIIKMNLGEYDYLLEEYLNSRK